LIRRLKNIFAPKVYREITITDAILLIVLFIGMAILLILLICMLFSL